MPVYNGTPYLSEAVQSILQQTYSDFEFLIIDDGSTDDSVAVIRQYRDERIRLVRNGANQGLVATLNHGLELARGDYIARMDCDDISEPARLAKQVCYLDQCPDVGVCGSWVRFFPRDKHFVWKFPADHEEIKVQMFCRVSLAHPAVMLRKSVFSGPDLRYASEFAHVEDYDLWTRAMNCTRISNIQQVLLRYRISPSQVCARYGPAQQRATAEVRRRLVVQLGIWPTAVELELHEALMRGEYRRLVSQLAEVESWLLSLVHTNARCRLYDERLFSAKLADLWFHLCCYGAVCKVCNWRRLTDSPLYRGSEPTARTRLRHLFLWLLRKRLVVRAQAC